VSDESTSRVIPEVKDPGVPQSLRFPSMVMAVELTGAPKATSVSRKIYIVAMMLTKNTNPSASATLELGVSALNRITLGHIVYVFPDLSKMTPLWSGAVRFIGPI